MATYRYFVDCQPCGGRQAARLAHTVRPTDVRPYLVVYHQQRYEVPVGPLARTIGACGTCGEAGLLITIQIRARGYGRPAPRCGGACLNGKTSCDCQCGGRCHGAGVCRCAA